jgi:hypothetical protein
MWRSVFAVSRWMDRGVNVRMAICAVEALLFVLETGDAAFRLLVFLRKR